MKLNKKFAIKLERSPRKGGWACVVWPNPAQFCGTRDLGKVKGKIDQHPFPGSSMALGDGRHKLLVSADIQKV